MEKKTRPVAGRKDKPTIKKSGSASTKPAISTRPAKKSPTRPEKPRGTEKAKSFSTQPEKTAKPRKAPAKQAFATQSEKTVSKRRTSRKPSSPIPAQPRVKNSDDTVRLNRYIANAGICSRREADVLIAAGSVMVNGKVMTEMGYKVKPGDVVVYGGERLTTEVKRYILLNKPKDYITTLDDPQNRKTVMMLVRDACRERIYPVGRLDRQTTGLLLFTNDGDLSKKLTHPSTRIHKLYEAELNKPLSYDHLKQIREGFELEDGFIKVDEIQYAGNGEDHRVLGIRLHSGRNRIVRRIFEALGYDVVRLDRTMFAGLTKKNLPRGRWRELTETEVSYLKMI